MSQLCAATKCNRTSRAPCDCCQQSLCLQHLSEHKDLLISQLNPLADEINALGDRLKSLNIEKITSSGHKKLEQWRNDCYQKIDHLFQQKSKELDQLVDEKVKNQQQEIARIQSKIAELIHGEETTRRDIHSLSSTIHHLKEQMDKIEHTIFDINTRPLMIDDNYIHIREINELDIAIFSPICKMINRPAGSKAVISSNGRFLLMHRKPNLCLVDQDMNIVKEVLWNHDDIYDMCWSSTINRFILVERKRIFLIKDETMEIDNVRTIEEREWLSCTCSENYLFLVTNKTGSSIKKFTLLPTIKLTKEWKSLRKCASDEAIVNIIYNNGTLGVVIINTSKKSLRFELKSAETLDRIWSLGFDTLCNQNIVFRCCLLTNDEWLVIDYEAKRLLHVTKDGNLKTMIPYDSGLRSANLFAKMLVVSTKSGVNFHNL
jgi:polyhydroxyalkanoate synthesis regulator phasin